MGKKTRYIDMLDIENLIVPGGLHERLALINHAESYVSTRGILPPFSYKHLSCLAEDIIKDNNLPLSSKAFLMICCSNAIWRKVLEKIPYQRRILFLPECLKNSQKCYAAKDAFGILCNACGACPIGDILLEAENLGYVTMITEGTTITQKLIEEGNIEAVIGVGCMETLQKLHNSITKYAIPSIAIPLLNNGCKNTNIDKKWLMQELGHFSQNNKCVKLNLKNLHNKTINIFNKTRISELIEHPTNKTSEIALEYILLGGQRLRPFFTMMMYEAFSTVKDEETAQRLALAVECFHKASLIHDDIEDNDVERYGEKTIHEQYGIPVAINTGDFLVGLGYKLISGCKLEPSLLTRCIKIVSQGHLALSIGQGEELINKQEKAFTNTNEMIAIAKNKTSAAFKVALLLGTSAAGADKKTENIIANLSDYIGIAYQIKDDLDDFNGNGGDLISENFSMIRSLILDSLSSPVKEHMLNSLMNKDLKTINRVIQENNILEKAEELLHFYLDKTFSSLDKITNLPAKLALHETMGKIFHAFL